MYINLDVFIWLEYCKHTGRPEFKRIGNYIIASTTDQREFETFRDSDFYEQRPLIKTDLLEQFMTLKFITIEHFQKFGIDFIMNFPSSHFDELCEWTRNNNQTSGRSERTVDHQSKRNISITINYLSL